MQFRFKKNLDFPQSESEFNSNMNCANPNCDCGNPNCSAKYNGYMALYRKKNGVDVFTGIVQIDKKIINTFWNEWPFNYQYSYFMLEDKKADLVTGEKRIMCPDYFMKEMKKYD